MNDNIKQTLTKIAATPKGRKVLIGNTIRNGFCSDLTTDDFHELAEYVEEQRSENSELRQILANEGYSSTDIQTEQDAIRAYRDFVKSESLKEQTK